MTEPFSSSLSVPAFVSLSQVGMRPIGQVQGSSVYRIGWQRAPRIVLRRSIKPMYLDIGYTAR